MPTKFRKNVWIKRGDYCIIEPIEEGDKVKGEIVRVLYKEQIRFIKSENVWPFTDKEALKEKSTSDLPPNSSDEEDDLIPNPNHQAPAESSEDSEDSESE